VQVPGIDRPGSDRSQIDVPWSLGDVLLASATVVGVVLATLAAATTIIALVGGGDDWLTGGDLFGLPAPLALAILLEAFFLGAVFLYARLKRGAIVRQLGFIKPEGRWPYGLAVAAWIAGVAALIGWNLLTEIIGIDLLKIPKPPEELVDYSGASLALPIVIIGLFGPFCEEVFFRGFALPAFARRYGLGGGMLISAALFSAFHFSIGSAVPIFIFGIVLAWLYVKTGSIYPSMFAHALQNIVTTVLAG